MFSNCKNSKKQGLVGLGVAIEYFTRNGYTVCIPLNDSQDYDLVVEVETKLYKVQVKTSSFVSPYGSYSVSLEATGGNSKKNFVHKKANEIVYDLLFVVCNNGTKYLIPKEFIKHIKSQICLCAKYDRFRLDSEAVKRICL